MIDRIRLISGLTLTAFLMCHLINHAFGLISIAAMDAAHSYLMDVWRTPPGTILLACMAMAHLGVASQSIVTRRTLKLPTWEWAQIISGMAIPLLLVGHVIGTRIGEEFVGIDPTYRSVLSVLWVISPLDGVIQTLALLVAWLHASAGIHFWMKTKRDYEKWRRPLLLGAVIMPTLAMAGYIAGGFELLKELDRDHMLAEVLTSANISNETIAPLKEIQPWVYAGVIVLLALPYVLRYLRHATQSRRGHQVTLSDGKKLRGTLGSSLLETLRAHGIDHAAVCGGRGRCTTCRVRIVTGGMTLPEPDEAEQKSLDRIMALPGVRLACQVRPVSDLVISPLLPPNASAADGRRPGGLQGEERVVACLFIDMRGSTKMGEMKLPYDVLFILNQFFAEMNLAVEETGGHYAQFNGDGLMALYGLNGEPPAQAAQKALAGARSMLARVEKLNETLASELPFPLQAGIGIHLGEAIVGAMGPPSSRITSAIGDTINTAARLESMTKAHEAVLVLSEALAEAAGLMLDPVLKHSTVPRGRAVEIGYFALSDLKALEPAKP